MGLQAGITVRIDQVRREFAGGVVALDHFSLQIEAGEFVAILGPSGCGKSTLLRLIAGLDQPQSGQISLGRGGASSSGSRRLAYVFQDAHLLPWRTVIKNVMLPLELRRVPGPRRLDSARAALSAVGLSDVEDRYPAQLSGGMRMRVSLARAMVVEPALLLLDEPFAALDEINRQHLDQQLRDLWHERRMTVLFVTHSTAEAAYLADRAVILSRRPGSIIEDLRVNLPPDRNADLRGAIEFARQTSLLFSALARGGG